MRFPEISGYELRESVCNTANAVLYRARRRRDSSPAVIKFLKFDNVPSSQISTFQRECELLVRVHGGRVHPVAPLRAPQHAGVVFEHFDGRLLESVLTESKLDLRTSLTLAFKLATALSRLHSAGIIHGDLRPQKILVDPECGAVFLADLSAAIGAQHVGAAQITNGDLAYISPEQTGRTRLSVDQRSDLYSLGVVIYRMLSGRLPFETRDPLELVHCHIACLPESPSSIDPSIPEMLSRVVMKLLAKHPEHRYQSARGLARDLVRCLVQWKERGTIAPFALAERDSSGRFEMSNKLYGREAELETLRKIFGGLALAGTPKLVLISGRAGEGKSALAAEFGKWIEDSRGSFAEGKFEQYRHEIPYAAVIDAFCGLVQRLMASSEEEIEFWRKRLGTALGEFGGLISALIPQLELMLGAQPKVPELPPRESQNRFHLVFRRFVGALASRNRPLVLFLDDLQWADPGSVGLLEEIATDPEIQGVLAIGSCREEDEGALPHLRRQEVQNASVTICLRPLDDDAMRGWLADTLHCATAETADLSTLIRQKTGGNPFFARQFLQTLHDNGLIVFAGQRSAMRGGGGWRWDTERIREAHVTDNVGELLASRIHRLGPAAQQVLKLAACIGTQFDSDTLMLVSGRNRSEIAEELATAVHEGLLQCVTVSPAIAGLPALGTRYRWAHDRIQQAAYGLIPEADRPETHLRIGRILFKQLTPGDDDNVFAVANHLNQGLQFIEDEQEKHAVAELNLGAGRLAKGRYAYESAITYFAAGQRLLPPSTWETRHELIFELNLRRARCEWLIGDCDLALALVADLLTHARSRLELASIYALGTSVHCTLRDPTRATAFALSGLSKLFGITIPLHPTEADVRRVAESTWNQLGTRRIEELISLPELADPEVAAALALIVECAPAAHSIDPNLAELLYCQIVSMSIRHGNSPSSAFGYANFGALVARLFGRWDEARRFAAVAVALTERREFSAGKAVTYISIAYVLSCFVQHLRESVPLLREAQTSALQNGAINYACYAAGNIAFYRLAIGDTLPDVAAEAKKQIEFVRSKDEMVYQLTAELAQLVKVLSGEDGALGEHSVGDFEKSLEWDIRSAADPWVPVLHFIYQTLLGILSENYEAAVHAALEGEEFAERVAVAFEGPELQFYAALARAAHYDDAGPERQEKYFEALLAAQQRHQLLQSHGPENFFNRYALISAEVARIEGRLLDAERLYEQAIQSARENGFVQNEGLGYEFAARFYRGRALEITAEAYLRKARDCYVRWGAFGKVKQLDLKYPELKEDRSSAPTPGLADLDALAIVKVSQAISSEIVLDRLLERLMRVVLQSAGAQRGYLLLRRGDELSLAAAGAVKGEQVDVQIYGDESQAEIELPKAIFEYVCRTREQVILDPAKPHPFSNDEYLLSHKPKSILCLPVLKQAELVAVLYLENDFVAQGFTPGRLSLLQLLASQAAISLQNAVLYEDLQRENAERKAAEASVRRSRQFLQDIIDTSAAVIFVKDSQGRYLLVNRRFEELFHISRANVAGKTDHDIFPRESAEAFQSFDKRAFVAESALESEELVPQDDDLHTYISIKAPLRDEKGRPYAVCGIATDITERKQLEQQLRELAQRLINAQEEERTRIARELHDEVGQQIAALGLSVDNLRRRILGREPDAGEQATRIHNQVSELATGIRNLSHELHPTILELLGLAAALRFYCGEFSSQTDVSVSFQASDKFEDVPSPLALCIYRVVQEALQNVARHSRAKTAEVHLARADGLVLLTVADPGVGFDMSRPRTSAGLGLVSIRERVRLVNGSVVVRSEPSRGTTLRVEIPLRGRADSDEPASSRINAA